MTWARAYRGYNEHFFTGQGVRSYPRLKPRKGQGGPSLTLCGLLRMPATNGIKAVRRCTDCEIGDEKRRQLTLV